MKTPEEILVDKGYDDVIVFRNPDYTEALIALSNTYQAVYDYNLMIEWLMKHDQMSYDDAADFISYNSSYSYGKYYPLIYYGEEYEEYMKEQDDEYEPLVFTTINDLMQKTK